MAIDTCSLRSEELLIAIDLAIIGAILLECSRYRALINSDESRGLIC
jgi:hypothetical protein